MGETVQKASIVGIQGGDGFVGCGFAVTSRHILTCAHVVNAAIGRNQSDGKSWPQVEINVVFPYLGPTVLKARVVYWKPQIDEVPSSRLGIEEDVAGLELLDDLPTLIAVQPQPASSDRRFRAFGYPKKTSQGGVAEGKLQVDLPCGWFQMDATCPEGLWAEPGYSGTAVWDQQDETVIYGMVVARKRDDSSKIAYMIPVQGLENAIAHLQLLEQLPPSVDRESSLWQLYLSMYQCCSPDDWQQSHPLPETVGEILMQLNDMGSVSIEGLEEPVERKCLFLARFLIGVGSELTETQKEGLREWGKQAMGKFLNLVDYFQTSHTNELAKPSVQDPCLVVQVSPNHLPYITQAFFIPDTECYNPKDTSTWHEVFCWDFENRQEMSKELELLQADDSVEALEEKLKARLAGYIVTCKKRYQSRCAGTLRIELILPLSLMNRPIECWELAVGGYQGSLVPASSFPLVIRSYDRTTDEYQEEMGEQWRSRWNQLKVHDTQPAMNHLAAVAAKIRAPQLNAAYQRQPSTVGIKVNEVLQQANEKSLMGAILGTATPIAIWLRRSPPAIEPDEAAGEGINQVLSVLDVFLGCLLGRIPLDALMVRAQAIESSIEPDETNFMVGHHLSLLWENPYLLPPAPPKQATE